MTLRIREDVATLAAGVLAEELTRLANQIRDALLDGQTVDVLEVLNQLQDAARKAKGPQLDLLEVTCALLKALTRTRLGRPELAAHQLLSDFGDAGEAFLDIVVGRHATPAEVAKLPAPLREQVQRLLDLGVLRQAGGFVDVAPAYQSFVADLIEPSPLREWREVTEARNEIFSQQMNERTAATFLATHFGIREQDATRHIRRHPPMEWLNTLPSGLRYQRPPIRNMQAQPAGPTPSNAAPEETLAARVNEANDSDIPVPGLQNAQLQ